MRVAVIHFHLRRGGVTRVIETAWRSLLERDIELLVFCGEDQLNRSSLLTWSR